MESIQKWGFGTWKVRDKFHSAAGIVIIMAILIAIVYVTGENRKFLLEGEEEKADDHATINMVTIEMEEAAAKKKNSTVLGETCDLFSGKWVYDNKSYPLYKERQCRFMTDDYACEKYGRKEFKFQNWRWQPHGCDLPRFNGTALLEELRNKRVVFIGDSLGKNQWVSLLCLVDLWIPDASQKYSQWHGSLITFKAVEYNASIDFYWEPLLVESNCDDPVTHRVRNRIMKIESIQRHAEHWVDADMLIFDSYTWWLEPNMTLLWGSFENPERIYNESDRLRRYEMAIKTWSDWLDNHLNRTKTKMFFTSLSPYHKQGENWGKDAGTNCYNETEPIEMEGYWGYDSDTGMMRIVDEAMDGLKKKGLRVQTLNITRLSEYRKDGHPTIYKRHWVTPTEEQLANPTLYADCVHWCLPGIPDVWNEILYSYILNSP